MSRKEGSKQGRNRVTQRAVREERTERKSNSLEQRRRANEKTGK